MHFKSFYLTLPLPKVENAYLEQQLKMPRVDQEQLGISSTAIQIFRWNVL